MSPSRLRQCLKRCTRRSFCITGYQFQCNRIAECALLKCWGAPLPLSCLAFLAKKCISVSACGWLLTVQTLLKVSFWTGATSAWTFPLCTHSAISFAFRFRAVPEPQSAVTFWLFPAVHRSLLGQDSLDKSQPNGEPSPKWRDFSDIPKRGSRNPMDSCGKVHPALFVHSNQSII